MQNAPSIWVLADDRPGHSAQALGVASKLGLPFQIKSLEYNLLSHLPNQLLGRSLRHIARSGRAALRAPWPDLVISAGRRTAPVARHIKAQNPKTSLVHLLWPETGIDEFSLIALPEHDSPPALPNITTTTLAPHGITTELLAEAGDLWRSKLGAYRSPRIALLVGGKSKYGDISLSDYAELVDRASTLAGPEGSLWITTSRRTGRAAESLLGSRSKLPTLLHRWGSQERNPYLGFLALADAIIVTGDSLSMCSEACFSGKPVFIFAPSELRSAKHLAHHKRLIALGLAQPLGDSASLRWKPSAARDEAALLARHIRDYLKLNQEPAKTGENSR